MQHTTATDQKLLSTKLMAIYECWNKSDSNTLTEFILSKKDKIPLKLGIDMSEALSSSDLTLYQATSLLYNKLNLIEDEVGGELDKITPLVQLRFNFYIDTMETRIHSVIHCLMSMSVVCKLSYYDSKQYPDVV